jgi:hypothetical protein
MMKSQEEGHDSLQVIWLARKAKKGGEEEKKEKSLRWKTKTQFLSQWTQVVMEVGREGKQSSNYAEYTVGANETEQ